MNPYRKQTFSSIFKDMKNNRVKTNPRLYQCTKPILEDKEDAYDKSEECIQEKQVTKKKMSSTTHSIKELGTLTVKEHQNNKNQKQAKQSHKNTHKTNNLNKVAQKSSKIQQKEVVCRYYCGCGFFSTQQDLMKEHIKKIHKRQYIKGSSHVLTIFGSLIFAWPQQNLIPKNIKISVSSQPCVKLSYLKYQTPQPQNKNFQQKIRKTRGRKKKVIQTIQTESQRFLQNQFYSEPISMCKKQKNDNKNSTMQVSILQKDPVLTQKHTIINNQLFQIKPHTQTDYIYSLQQVGKKFDNSHCQNYLCQKNDLFQNTLEDKKNYTCGVCNLSYEREFFFKKHILTFCRILNHELSSHHLIKKEQSNENFTQNLIVNQQKKQEPQKSQIPVQLVQKNQIPAQLVQKSQIPEQLVQKSQIPVQLVQITNKQYWQFQHESQVRLNQQNQQAYCNKCQRNFNHAQNYATHIFHKHSGIVPQGSSHMLIRLIRKNIKQALLFPINSKSEFLESTKYVCPCKMQVQFSRADFVNHVMKRHKGKTPLMRMAGAQ